MRQIAGWSISILFYAFGVIIPSSETTSNTEEFEPQKEIVNLSMPAIDRLASIQNEAKTINILTMRYSFGERGKRVSALQRVIGTVKVDGEYGGITRREHLEVLEKLNLPQSGVPSVETQNTNSDSEYNIPSDPDKRCPQWESHFAEIGLLPVEVFSYIAWRESGCRPSAQNATWDKDGNMTYHLNKDKSYDTGLLQINSTWKSVTQKVCGKNSTTNYMHGLKDPKCNMLVAKYLMENTEGKLANWRIYKN